jgi:hypothetical protein
MPSKARRAVGLDCMLPDLFFTQATKEVYSSQDANESNPYKILKYKNLFSSQSY